MKKQLILIGFILTWMMGYAFADDSFPANPWISRTPQDMITIQNSSGDMLTIEVTVSPNSAGISVDNCGDTTHIDSGSSAICTTSDAHSPVTFSTDSASNAATGTYMIKRN